MVIIHDRPGYKHDMVFVHAKDAFGTSWATTDSRRQWVVVQVNDKWQASYKTFGDPIRASIFISESETTNTLSLIELAKRIHNFDTAEAAMEACKKLSKKLMDA